MASTQTLQQENKIPVNQWYQPSPYHASGPQQAKPSNPIPPLSPSPAPKRENTVPTLHTATDTVPDRSVATTLDTFWEEERNRTGHPGPKVCLPGRKDAIPTTPPSFPQPLEPEIKTNPDTPTPVPSDSTGTSTEQSPAPIFSVKARSQRVDKKENSLSRLLSAQVWSCVLLLMFFSLLRLIWEPAFVAFQSALQQQLEDIRPVVSVMENVQQLKQEGLESTLRRMLTQGMDEGTDLPVRQPAPSSSSVSAQPAGGIANPTDAAENVISADLPDTAAAAGGRYEVSMQQQPLALAVIAGTDAKTAGTICPVAGTLSCGYGPREHPFTGQPDFHTGIDLAAPAGTPIAAAASGVVEQVGVSSSLGNYVILRHSSKAVTTYSHCSTLLVQEGEAVDRGQEIALVGSTGVSTGPHLHFECIVDGMITDPSWILSSPTAQEEPAA